MESTEESDLHDDLPMRQMNGTAVAGIAYVSMHAKSEKTRESAKTCLAVVLKKLSQDGR